jgi:hypothetical protein
MNMHDRLEKREVSEERGQERSLGCAVFRICRPCRMKSRAESYGHVRQVKNHNGTPIIATDYVCTGSEQERKDEKGVPILIAKDTRAEVIWAKGGSACGGGLGEDGAAAVAQDAD